MVTSIMTRVKNGIGTSVKEQEHERLDTVFDQEFFKSETFAFVRDDQDEVILNPETDRSQIESADKYELFMDELKTVGIFAQTVLDDVPNALQVLCHEKNFPWLLDVIKGIPEGQQLVTTMFTIRPNPQFKDIVQISLNKWVETDEGGRILRKRNPPAKEVYISHLAASLAPAIQKSPSANRTTKGRKGLPGPFFFATLLMIGGLLASRTKAVQNVMDRIFQSDSNNKPGIEQPSLEVITPIAPEASTDTPTPFQPTLTQPVLDTNTPITSPTPEAGYSEAELNQMAEDVKSNLPELVRSMRCYFQENIEPDKAPNIFEYKEDDPQSEELLKLTQKLLIIIFSGRSDLLEGMNLQPYILDGNIDGSRDNNPIFSPIKFKINRDLLLDLEARHVVVAFTGTVVPVGEKSVKIGKILDGAESFAPIFEDGKPAEDQSGIGVFNHSIGFTVGLGQDDWLPFASSHSDGLFVSEISIKNGKDDLKFSLGDFNRVLISLSSEFEAMTYHLHTPAGLVFENSFGSQVYIPSSAFKRK